MPVKAGEIQVKRNPNGTFPKGVSGNPDGKPVGTRHMTTILKEALIKVSEDKGTSTDKEIVRTLAEKAVLGDMQAMKLIFNYMDGMPAASPEDPGTEDNPIVIRVKYE